MSTKRNAYVNGKIFTSDDSNLYAEAMIVEDGHHLGRERSRHASRGLKS
ncbi:MAG: hypothetical protein ACLVC2_00670 [Emergencia timonensis]